MGFERTVIFWGAIGAACLCIIMGVALILKEREEQRRHRRLRKRREKGPVYDYRAVGIALFALAVALSVFAMETFVWPR